VGLNVLMLNRTDSERCPGGDTVQMEATASFLRDSGHRVTVSFELQPDLAGVDLVHLFNLTRPHETVVQADHVRRGGKPYVLSSVYWDLENVVPWHAYEFPRCLLHLCIPAGLRRALRRAALWHRRPAGGPTAETAVPRVRSTAESPVPHQADPVRLQASILRGARLVFPNSRAERDLLLARFPFLDSDRICVTPNGIEPPDLSDARQGVGTKRVEANAPFVCAGAIGPRKNQLNLVKAFRHLAGERLLIIGQPSPGSAAYERAVRRAAGANVEIRGPVPHAEMSAMLAGAKALVQPSLPWRPPPTARRSSSRTWPPCASTSAISLTTVIPIRRGASPKPVAQQRGPREQTAELSRLRTPGRQHCNRWPLPTRR